jgi:hypothetical protein
MALQPLPELKVPDSKDTLNIFTAAESMKTNAMQRNALAQEMRIREQKLPGELELNALQRATEKAQQAKYEADVRQANMEHYVQEMNTLLGLDDEALKNALDTSDKQSEEIWNASGGLAGVHPLYRRSSADFMIQKPKGDNGQEAPPEFDAKAARHWAMTAANAFQSMRNPIVGHVFETIVKNPKATGKDDKYIVQKNTVDPMGNVITLTQGLYKPLTPLEEEALQAKIAYYNSGVAKNALAGGGGTRSSGAKAIKGYDLTAKELIELGGQISGKPADENNRFIADSYNMYTLDNSIFWPKKYEDGTTRWTHIRPERLKEVIEPEYVEVTGADGKPQVKKVYRTLDYFRDAALENGQGIVYEILRHNEAIRAKREEAAKGQEKNVLANAAQNKNKGKRTLMKDVYSKAEKFSNAANAIGNFIGREALNYGNYLFGGTGEE